MLHSFVWISSWNNESIFNKGSDRELSDEIMLGDDVCDLLSRFDFDSFEFSSILELEFDEDEWRWRVWPWNNI